MQIRLCNPVMEHTELETKLTSARERFGDMLLNWRKRNGWTGRTWEEWHAADPKALPIAVVNSVITGLEKKRNARTIPQTFIALGVANERLAREDRGAIADRVLRDRIYHAEPIRHDDGTPWDGADFFSAYTGFIDIPEELLTADTAELIDAATLRDRFQQQRGSQSPRNALDTLLGFEPRIARGDRDRIEEVLFGFSEFRDDEAPLGRMVDRLLRRWGATA